MSSTDTFYEDREKFKTIQNLMDRSFTKYKNGIFCKYCKDGEIFEKTYQEFYYDTISLANTLKELSLQGLHIAIIGKTSYEWIVSYLGIMNSESVVVPIDKELPVQAKIEQILLANVTCLFYDNDYLEEAICIKEAVNNIEYIVNFDQNIDGSIYFRDLLKKPNNIKLQEVKADAIAQIVFTSGTTGKSKGVVLTHGNIASGVMFSSMVLDLSPKDLVLSILPNNHTYELTTGILTSIYFGSIICINEKLKLLKKNLKLYKPTTMVAVPAVLEMMRKEILKEIKRQKKENIFKYGLVLSKILLKFNIDIRRIIFKDILQVLGGNFKIIVCGGAHSAQDLQDFFRDVGIIILEGYGMSECSPLIAANTDRYSKPGSVGKVSPFCQVKIVDDEILVCGKNVMQGYYKDTAATEECFDGEWFKTGDLGFLDNDNYIYITGRKKNLIILKNGENISPEELEKILLELPIIKEAIVYGEDNLIKAEVYLEDDGTQDLDQKVKDEVKRINNSLPLFKQIQAIKIRDCEFEKTTTRKIKRNITYIN